jgi:hypothetical protein
MRFFAHCHPIGHVVIPPDELLVAEGVCRFSGLLRPCWCGLKHQSLLWWWCHYDGGGGHHCVVCP